MASYLGSTKQTEISPERTTKEVHAIQLNPIVLKNVHIRSLSMMLHSFYVFGKRCSIILMIAKNVDDWLSFECLAGPQQPLHADMNVPGQKHNVGIVVRNITILKLNVQIAQNMQPHLPNQRE